MEYIYKDKVGNRIKADSDVYFDPVQGVVQIVSIDDPGRKRDGSDRPGYINMLVRMPFIPSKNEKGETGKDDDGNHNIAFGFLLLSRDPSKELEEAVKGNRALAAVKDILDRGSRIAKSN